jgi:hypothetical protein
MSNARWCGSCLRRARRRPQLEGCVAAAVLCCRAELLFGIALPNAGPRVPSASVCYTPTLPSTCRWHWLRCTEPQPVMDMVTRARHRIKPSSGDQQNCRFPYHPIKVSSGDHQCCCLPCHMGSGHAGGLASMQREVRPEAAALGNPLACLHSSEACTSRRASLQALAAP